jgi:hypothetical protein
MMLNNAIFLHNLRANEEFAKTVAETYPSLSDNIKSYRQNPRCKCRKDIIKYVNDNVEELSKSADEWTKFDKRMNEETKVPSVEDRKVEVSNAEMKKAGNDIQNREVNRVQRNNIAGDVYEIPAEPQSFKELISHLQKERAVYRSFNVMESEKDGKKIWLVFFV